MLRKVDKVAIKEIYKYVGDTFLLKGDVQEFQNKV